MSGYVIIDCTDIPGEFDCCISCHNDDDAAMTGGWWLDADDREILVCCGASEYLQALPDRGRGLVDELVQRRRKAREET